MLCQAVVSKVISNSEDSGKIIKQLTAMTKYDDFRFYIMKCIKQLLVKTPLAVSCHLYFFKLFLLISIVTNFVTLLNALSCIN